MELEEIRLKLDQVDSELVALFEQRMALSLLVAEVKRKNAQPILQPEREKIVLSSRVAKLKDARWAKPAEVFFQTLMDLGKQAQMDYIAQKRNQAVVAFQGVAGGYGEQAAVGHFQDAAWLACATFGDVIKAVREGEADYAYYLWRTQ
jgi:chorismate mutase/prephenate dehydratase